MRPRYRTNSKFSFRLYFRSEYGPDTLQYPLFPFEVDEFKTGMRREGLYFGVIAFAQKGACAMALWVVGVALSWIGYVPDAAQSEATLQGIRTINGGVEAAFLVASILLC